MGICIFTTLIGLNNLCLGIFHQIQPKPTGFPGIQRTGLSIIDCPAFKITGTASKNFKAKCPVWMICGPKAPHYGVACVEPIKDGLNEAVYGECEWIHRSISKKISGMIFCIGEAF